MTVTVIDTQRWAWAAHHYCSDLAESAFYPPWDCKMSISFRAE